MIREGMPVMLDGHPVTIIYVHDDRLRVVVEFANGAALTCRIRHLTTRSA